MEAQTTKYQMSESDFVEMKNFFSYHPPKENQQQRYVLLRNKAQELAHDIMHMVPPCADRSAAIRKLRECIMTANAAIACNE